VWGWWGYGIWGMGYGIWDMGWCVVGVGAAGLLGCEDLHSFRAYRLSYVHLLALYGVWRMVYGLWCMVYGLWCMLCFCDATVYPYTHILIGTHTHISLHLYTCIPVYLYTCIPIYLLYTCIHWGELWGLWMLCGCIDDA
jgi:hypothetical protein